MGGGIDLEVLGGGSVVRGIDVLVLAPLEAG